MASYELSAFDRFNAITVVGAIEQQTPATLNVGFWVRDPNQFLIYPDQVKAHPRQDFLWEQTCFEIFIGVKDEDFYREINLSPSKLGKPINLKNIASQRICRPLLHMTLS